MEDRIIRAVERLLVDSESRSREFAREIQTRLLTSFERYARRMDARWTALRLLTLDNITSIEELNARLDKIEGKQP